MKLRLLCVCAVLCGLSAVTVRAEEPILPLIEAMRDRGYSDYALLYIEDLRARPDVSQSIKDILSYEEYKVHQAASRLEKVAAQKQAALERALASLERFAKESPNHPLAAQANSERAGIFLDKAKALIWEARSENNVRAKVQQQEEARQWITKARQVYQQAQDQFGAALEKWKGKFLDEKNDAEEFAARREAEIKFIQAQYNLAMCTYQEARSYDAGDGKNQALLKQAAEEFEAINMRYRSQGGGILARLMQGKCFEEQGELGRAMGIYDEMLQHPGETEFMQQVKAQTFYFKMIVLNTDERKDWKLVTSEATKWLQDNRKLSKSTTGLGIQWERARAFERLTEKADVAEEDRDNYLRQAYNDAQEIALYAGEFRDPATAMMQRLEPLVKGKGGDPESFGVAFSMVKNLVRQHAEFNDKVKEAKGSEQKTAAQAELDLHLQETERLIKLGLSLVDEKTAQTDVAAIKYYLAYTLYMAKKPYDAAVVGNYIAATAGPEEAQTAQDAAYLALGALNQIYVSQPDADRDEEREMMAEAAELLATRWPDSPRADDARLILGDIYRNAGEPLKASEYFNKVNQTNERYDEALLKAGQAYRVAYLQALSGPENERPAKEELDQWAQLAVAKLTDGLARMDAQLSSEGTPKDIYIAGKITLADIRISEGQEAEALKLLLEGDHAVIKHIQVADEQQRPKTGAKSRPVAIQAYQLVLRAYMGTQQIDLAIQTMGDLERVAGSDDPEALTQIYIDLGLKLREEIERLRAAGDAQRLSTVVSAFEAFLNELVKRKDTLKYNTLLWIAESYANLGSGMEGDVSSAAVYFSKAAETYNEILARGKADPFFVEERFLPGVQARIAVLQKLQGDYETALETITAVLKPDPRRIGAQFDAADILKTWAEKGGDSEKYLDAVMGNKRMKDSPIYGYSQLANLIRRVMDSPQATPDLDEKFYRALYEVADCQQKYAGGLGDQAEHDKYLNGAKATVQTFALYSAGKVDRQLWQQFDTLYREILTDLGEVPTPLERPEEIAAVPTDTEPEPLAGDSGTGRVVSTPAADERDSGTSGLIVGLVLLVALGITGGVVFMMMKPKQRRRTLPGREPAAAALAGGPSPKAPSDADADEQARKLAAQKAAARKKAAAAKARQQAQEQRDKPESRRAKQPPQA